MSQLLFQFQSNDKVNKHLSSSSLEHLFKQNDVSFKTMHDGNEHEAVIVYFEFPEDAAKAFKIFDGMEFMGSLLKIKQERKEETKKSPSRHYRQKGEYNRNEYSRDDYQNYNQYQQAQGAMYNNPYQEFTKPLEPQQYPCRILVPSDMVKVILGKGGATISAMQNKTSTKIDIHRDKGHGRSHSEDTMITIKGDPEPFSLAIREIVQVINEELEKREQESDCLQLKLLAHDLLCGRIIGKGGNNLKQTRQESNVSKLIISNSIYEEGSQMIPSGMVCTGERVITIEGSVEGICKAESLLSKRLRDYMEKDTKNAANNMGTMAPYGEFPYGGGPMGYGYNPNMMFPRMYGAYPLGNMGYPFLPMNGYPGILGHGYPPYQTNSSQTSLSQEPEKLCIIIPTKEVGAVIGRNGGYVSRIKQYSGAQIKVVKAEEGGESKVEIVGPPESQWRASLCVFSKIKETMKVAYSEAQLKTEYMVPGSCVGRIIGKKGQVVQDIQDKAQSDIEVPKEKQGADEVPVFITGTFNGTQMALTRIRDIVQRAQGKGRSETHLVEE